MTHRQSTNDEISTTVIEAVARSEGIGPTELPPLYGAVDPDALDSLLGGSPGRDDAGSIVVRFEYAGYLVTARGDGEVRVRPTSPDGGSAVSA